MNMQVTDWAAHYKAVRSRIVSAGASVAPAPAPAPPPVHIPVPEPPAEIKARPATIYVYSVGPALQVAKIKTFYVTYAGGINAMYRARRAGRKHRKPHPLDRRAYSRPIGPHERPQPGRLPVSKRDWLHVATPIAIRTPRKQIIREVCAEYNVSESDVLSHRRTQCLTRPRQKICYRLKHETMASLPEIGRLINRDHSTVVHSIRKATALIAAGEMTAPAPAACGEG
jgi:hypothetical protein